MGKMGANLERLGSVPMIRQFSSYPYAFSLFVQPGCHAPLRYSLARIFRFSVTYFLSPTIVEVNQDNRAIRIKRWRDAERQDALDGSLG